MKKCISVLLAVLLIGSQMSVYAGTEYISEGLKATQEEYAALISEAIEKSEYEENQIDKEHIFIVENTNPIAIKNAAEPVAVFVALPIVDTEDISYAAFERNEYKTAVTNFAFLEGVESPYGNKLKQYIEDNNLSEPTEIKNWQITERLHLYAFNVVCDGTEYIIPYHFTDESIYNLTNDEECNLEYGEAYTISEFNSICDKEQILYEEYRKEQSEKDYTDKTYVDDNEEVVEGKTDNESSETVKEENAEKETEEEEQGSASARTYTFEELTGLAREDIDHIVIRSGVDGVGYSTAYDKIISDVYNTINTKSFNVDMNAGNSDGWSYQILFFDKDNSGATYTISTGIVVKEKDGLTYRTSNEEELKKVVADAYDLIANDCSNWAADYIVQAKDLGFLEGVSDLNYKEPITREKFCEIVYNMLDKTMDKTWSAPEAIPFGDTNNPKVLTLYYEGIVKGKGMMWYNLPPEAGPTVGIVKRRPAFAPDDFLTREEAATILYRVIEFMELEMPQTVYDESIPYYADKETISDWAFNAVFIMREMGIMVGVSETEFSPKEAYTAEQAIATIIRVCEAR